MQKLTWKDLDESEKAAATEQYIHIREYEEQRSRDETNNEYPEPIDPDFVKNCTFYRKKIHGETVTLVII